MSNKIDDDMLAELEQNAAPVPFFAHLLSRQAPPANPGTVKPTSCLQDDCTKKYPSDGDESTSKTWDGPTGY